MEFKRPKRAKGGVGLIYKKNKKIELREDLEIESKTINGQELETENIWAETSIDGKTKLIIAVIYKHPGSSVQGLQYFTNELILRLKKINKENKKCVILGDLNIDGTKMSMNEHVKNFFETILDHHWVPTITLPTRITSNTASLIDHIIINEHLIKNATELESGNIFSEISDHLPNFLVIKHDKMSTSKNRPMVRIFGEKNVLKFKEALINADWKEFYETNDAEKALEIFYKIYNSAFNKSFPLKILSRKRAKDKKWITAGIRKSIGTKDKLYQKSLLNPTIANINNFKAYRNKLTTCIRTMENTYYHNKITEGNNSTKVLWETVGDIMNPKKIKGKTLIEKLIVNKKVITDNQEIADELNNYFTNIGKKLADMHKNNGDFAKYLKTPNKANFFLGPVTKQETAKIISKLNSNKAGGDDNIKPKLLKECNDLLSEQITHIINLSFQNGRVPYKLKIAKVIPIFKKNDKTDPNNYRPISLLSTINKILEKFVHMQLMRFLNKHKILFEYQFGFREKYSTTLAITEIIENLLDELEKGNLVAGIYLDLSKAFDTVDHDILLKKLWHYGIRGIPLQWFNSYLKDRKQYTFINGKKSSLTTVPYGVPQGSVLGPLLFLLYTNDMVNAIDNNTKLRLFADDSNLFIAENNATILKTKIVTSLTSVFKWLSANKLTANVTKTNYTIFGKNKDIPCSLNSITIDNVIIKKVPYTKYLGIHLDEKLDWEPHIAELTKSLGKTINAFKIIKIYVPNKNKLQLYYAYVY
jgi:hypothetical protein